MNERLLQYIWQEKLFQTGELKLETGEDLVIQYTGEWNHDQGPDFLNARIRIDGTYWAGHIELHVKSSHWHQHRHQHDPGYRPVILHVVWENDDSNLSERLPTLVLQDRVSGLLLTRYNEMLEASGKLICENWLSGVSTDLWAAWKVELLSRRLARKAQQLQENLKICKGSWEELSWWALARVMGGTVNGAFFEAVAMSISTKLLARHRNYLLHLEALLLGQSHLLEKANSDPYVQLLQREYDFLRHKYQLPYVHGRASKLRMRPAGFPEVRLAQLARLIYTQSPFVTNWINQQSPDLLLQSMRVTASSFWDHHYTLTDASVYAPKHLGTDLADQLLINAVAPLFFAYGVYHKHNAYTQRAVEWLSLIKPERNSIITHWQRVGVRCESAADSQALLELHKFYCQEKRCLDCNVGCSIISRPSGLA